MNSFYATMKLVTCEEVLGEILPQEEEGVDFFVVSNAITITENQHVDVEKGVVMSGMVPRKWMMYSNEELIIIYRQHVVSVSELDKFGVDFYKKALIAAKCSSPIKKKVETEKNSGYIGKIEQFRKMLDKTFNNSPSNPDLNKES